ncbi:hypothetical protein MSEN_13490 [Mycolicibacter senuensis]|uniref:Uncharacterized protein n=1 Tax=Mycolicibacter senuensis TaxID=386913 RepID=A0A7I9XI20_9MYCO|nr:hypothetical protein MSEN_13490 [Mycolicibacter senuensis]
MRRRATFAGPSSVLTWPDTPKDTPEAQTAPALAPAMFVRAGPAVRWLGRSRPALAPAAHGPVSHPPKVVGSEDSRGGASVRCGPLRPAVSPLPVQFALQVALEAASPPRHGGNSPAGAGDAAARPVEPSVNSRRNRGPNGHTPPVAANCHL